MGRMYCTPAGLGWANRPAVDIHPHFTEVNSRKTQHLNLAKADEAAVATHSSLQGDIRMKVVSKMAPADIDEDGMCYTPVRPDRAVQMKESDNDGMCYTPTRQAQAPVQGESDEDGMCGMPAGQEQRPLRLVNDDDGMCYTPGRPVQRVIHKEEDEDGMCF